VIDVTRRRPRASPSERDEREIRYNRDVPELPFDELFAVTPAVRYVAFASGQDVGMRERTDLESASAAESDLYEELLVNPTMLTLARQRGEIDCGGLEFVIVGYGNFRQLVVPLRSGHVSIAFDREADPLQHLDAVRDLLGGRGLLDAAP
jgi:hypothetical protein